MESPGWISENGIANLWLTRHQKTCSIQTSVVSRNPRPLQLVSVETDAFY